MTTKKFQILEDDYQIVLDDGRVFTHKEMMEACEPFPECRCGGKGVESHTCPFATEINGDSTECKCCESCEEQCAMDI